MVISIACAPSPTLIPPQIDTKLPMKVEKDCGHAVRFRPSIPKGSGHGPGGAGFGTSNLRRTGAARYVRDHYSLSSDRVDRFIPAATENDSCIRWYKGRDCGPRSEQGIAAKAAPVVNEGPAGAVRQGRTGVRHKTAKKVSTFFAVGIRG